ncbi:tetraspanin 8 L homeolog [Xenopus laevis]|uniref:Tetraspanin n=1 Tax=Xenopus laevis TaxID=8355 RepID=Q7SYR5_XENLA|nr:tetraspanin 8 L homeolog [Xenopus laevis]AAH54295.1 Tm4sf3-prov protein [Xenopus laevis]
MAGVSKCIKYSMFAFNFLFWLCGCVILGVSIWVRVSKNVQKELNIEGGSLLAAVDLMIAVGAIIMVLGFFGCCGAIRESRCLLLLFFIGLFLILALQITAGILGVVYKPKIDAQLTESFQKLLPLSGQDESFKNSFETIQKENECCGLVHGYTDWGANVPASCNCPSTGNCVSSGGNKYYKETCLNIIADFFKKHLAIIIGIAFGLAAVELFGLGFSMTLYCQIGKK